MEKLKGKKIVIIGGSRGTGLAIVGALYNAAADVLVVGRNRTSLADVISAFPKARTLNADVRELETVVKIFKDSPDVVVLAAGASPAAKPFYELDWETFTINWDSDVRASFLLAKYALTAGVKAGTLVIFISSGAAIGGSPITGGYAGSKRTQMFLADYAQEASNRLGLGLRFIALAPWRLMNETGTGNVIIPGYAKYLGIPEKDFVDRMTLAQTKEDVARAVADFSETPPAAEDKNIFISSARGVVPESNIQSLLSGKS